MATSLKLVFGRNVRYFRKRLQLTQFQLSEIINCSPSYIGFIENGKSSVSFQTIESLASALQISVSQLFACSSDGEKKYEMQDSTAEYSPEAARIVADLEILISKYSKNSKLPHRRKFPTPRKK